MSNDISDRALIDLPEARRYVYRDENDSSRDDILTDAINDVSDSVIDYCEREFKPTTVPDRSGTDGVGNATTTFVAASGAFTSADVGKRIRISDTYYTIASVTNATTIVLNATVAAGTGKSWDFGEARLIRVSSTGYVDFRPYDLAEFALATMYADRADLDDIVLATADYQLTRRPGGTYYDMYVPAPEFAPAHEGFGTMLTLRGWWGMATVPGAVKLATKQWVKNIAENPGSYASSSMSGYDVIPEVDTVTLNPGGMPAAVRYRLDNWARGDLPIR